MRLQGLGFRLELVSRLSAEAPRPESCGVFNKEVCTDRIGGWGTLHLTVCVCVVSGLQVLEGGYDDKLFRQFYNF